MLEYVSWTRMEDGTQEDWDLLSRLEHKANADVVDRVLTHLKLLDVDWGGYRINRYQHSLQSATMAERDGADDEMVVAALLHDIGDIISPYNHSEFAAALVRPYVSEKVYWIVKHHGLFQSYYYNEYIGGDRNSRDRFKDHPHYQACVDFCANYDQNAFDPDYDTLPLEHFEPAVRRVFDRKTESHLELVSGE
ncbi:MAG: HD domain-containing protein [Rhodospirillaceae bacterium]|nr:HD domain-containing protein [Rhodospirillaceae bacterium]